MWGHSRALGSWLATVTGTVTCRWPCLQLGKRIASSLNISAPTVMTQRDVPAATRAIVPLLVQNGAREPRLEAWRSSSPAVVYPWWLSRQGIVGFSSGVNTASLPPHVPRVFLWRDNATSSEVITTVHPFGYGGITVEDCIVLPCMCPWCWAWGWSRMPLASPAYCFRGADLDEALCPDYKGDNAVRQVAAGRLTGWLTKLVSGGCARGRGNPAKLRATGPRCAPSFPTPPFARPPSTPTLPCWQQ